MGRLACWLVALLIAAPSITAAEPFSEFRVPDHSWRSGSGYFSFWGFEGKNSSPTSNSTSRELNGSLETALSYGRDSEMLSRTADLRLSGALSSTQRDGRTQSAFSNSQARDRNQDRWQSVYLGGSQRAYLGSSAWAVGLSTNFRASFGEGWWRQDYFQNRFPLASRARDSDQYHDYDYRGSAAMSLGRGRVRDVTVVMDVHVLEERLLTTKAIAAPLMPSTREKLARVFFAGRDLSNAHDRPDRFLWREVERVLREDGALVGAALDAFSLMRIQESYARRGLARTRGVFAGALLEGLHSHHIQRSERQSSSRYFYYDTLYTEYNSAGSARRTDQSDALYAGALAQIHRPLGWRWQWDASGSIAFPIRTGDSGLRTSSAMSLDWIIADRWLAGARVTSERSYLHHGDNPTRTLEDGWRSSFGLSTSYFVEDHVSINVSYQTLQNRRRTKFQDRQSYNLQNVFQLGVNYRFFGRLDAPGVMESMQLRQ